MTPGVLAVCVSACVCVCTDGGNDYYVINVQNEQMCNLPHTLYPYLRV